jgi:two-component system NarL family response regulator
MVTENTSIVIVEQQPIMRTALSMALTAEGMNVLAELDGSEGALENAVILNPDVILLAVGTPGWCELDNIPALRQQIPHSAIVALITGEMAGQEQAAVDRGAHLVLTKSTPRSELLTAIMEMSRKRMYPATRQMD